jgi:hypothetical protein
MKLGERRCCADSGMSMRWHDEFVVTQNLRWHGKYSGAMRRALVLLRQHEHEQLALS